MAIENGGKGADTVTQKPTTAADILTKGRWMNMALLMLRMAIVLATSTTALTMGRNRQSITKAVAVVGTTTLFQTHTAKFQQTPAFVFFVIANAIAGFYNSVLLILTSSFKWKTFHVAVHLLDLAMLALVATGAAAATSMAELGKKGNLSAQWSPVCDHFSEFCMRGGLAIAASFVGVFLLLILNNISIITLYNKCFNDRASAN